MFIQNPLGIAASLLLGGAFSTTVAYYAVGASFSGFILIMYIGAILISILSLRVSGLRKFARIVASLLMIFTIPLQTSNLWRLYLFDAEANTLVRSLESLKEQNKQLPASRDSLPVENFIFKPQIQYYQNKPDGFIICYFVTDPSTSYCYTSGKGWTYKAE